LNIAPNEQPLEKEVAVHRRPEPILNNNKQHHQKNSWFSEWVWIMPPYLMYIKLIYSQSISRIVIN